MRLPTGTQDHYPAVPAALECASLRVAAGTPARVGLDGLARFAARLLGPEPLLGATNGRSSAAPWGPSRR